MSKRNVSVRAGRVRPSKEAAVALAISLAPQYAEALCELQGSRGGRLQFPEEFRILVDWSGPLVTLYENEQQLNGVLALGVMGKHEFRGWAQELADLGNWRTPDGSGRTIYIGKRKNGKCLRVYEKGMQLGAEWHPWVRWELSYGNRSRILPWEVLTQPGQYVVGKELQWPVRTESTGGKIRPTGGFALPSRTALTYERVLGLPTESKPKRIYVAIR